MADINKRLLTSSDGIPAPQHKVKGESDFEFTEGSSGAQHTKIVDSSGQPISIDDELKSIKRTQAEILDRLDKGIDTRVTRSKVEEVLVERDVYNEGLVIRPYPPNWAKGAILSLHIHGSTGDFSSNGGLQVEGRLSLNSANDVIKTNVTDSYRNANQRIAIHFYPGAIDHDDPTSWVYVYGVDSMLTNRLWLRFKISGDFSEGEGIDFSSKIIYLG